MLIFTPLAFAEVDLVKVDKSDRIMFLMDGEMVVKQFQISLGASPKGHKQQEGDERTPEGVYTLDYVNENSSYHRSMHISYPNTLDKAIAEKNGVSPGGFIMIHGQRNGFGWLARWTQKRDWTDGCIAITNSEMDDFLELVQVGTKISIQW
jgi:murein L,D-transpeptidase YafK